MKQSLKEDAADCPVPKAGNFVQLYKASRIFSIGFRRRMKVNSRPAQPDENSRQAVQSSAHTAPSLRMMTQLTKGESAWR